MGVCRLGLPGRVHLESLVIGAKSLIDLEEALFRVVMSCCGRRPFRDTALLPLLTVLGVFAPLQRLLVLIRRGLATIVLLLVVTAAIWLGVISGARRNISKICLAQIAETIMIMRSFTPLLYLPPPV